MAVLLLCLVNNQMMSGDFIDFYCCYSVAFVLVFSVLWSKKKHTHTSTSVHRPSPRTHASSCTQTLLSILTDSTAGEGWIYLKQAPPIPLCRTGAHIYSHTYAQRGPSDGFHEWWSITPSRFESTCYLMNPWGAALCLKDSRPGNTAQRRQCS